jgi:16S rRNA (cytosine1402-N4)-methyltransferase
MVMQSAHLPVMAAEVIQYLVTRTDGVFIDCSTGSGAHAHRILNNAPEGRLLGIDVDGSALEVARGTLGVFGERVELEMGNFASLASIAARHGIEGCDGILFDLGFSSMQLDEPSRGFSHALEGPIDMRLDQSSGRTARDLIVGASERELARIILEFGEERRAHPIARAIIEARDRGRLETTRDLAAAVLTTKPQKRQKTLSRVFMALRIAVNQELDSLRDGLAQAVPLLRPGGRLVVLSYHSLEDRLVKRYFTTSEKPCVCPRELPQCMCGKTPALRILTRRIVTPSEVEIAKNSRSRSAKLRAAERLAPGEEP